MKTINVKTYDSRIFQAVMTIVVKNDKNEYAVLFKDICEMINIDVKSVNSFLKTNYDYFKEQSIPHLELPITNAVNEWYYIQGGVKRPITSDDVFIVSKDCSAALPYALLDIMRNNTIETPYEEKFAVIFSMTLVDCLRYAPKFEY